MRFSKRLGFYTLGLSLGCVLVFLFFGDRPMRCAYFPNARVLQHLSERKIRYSREAELQMRALGLDRVRVQQILHRGRVDFSQSEPRKAPCKTYRIAQDSLYVMVQMCERSAVATVYKVAFAN